MNIREVAQIAGVSTATVSRVLNNTGPVRPATRERVLAIIEQQNFRPNLLSQKLRRAETGMLLVLVSSIANPFCAITLRGIENEAERHGYHILLCNSESDPERELTYLRLLRGKVVDGVITMDAVSRTSAMKNEIGNLPWVQCGEFEEDAAPYVSIDNHAAAKAVVAYLVSTGRRRIGLISAKGEYMYSTERERGYRDGVAEAGLTFSRVAYTDGVTDFNEGAIAFAELQAHEEKCDAIFAISDMLACGAMNAASRSGVRIPAELAVVGFDDLPYAEITSPRLTTVRQPMFELGAACARILVERLAGESSQGKNLLLPWTLVQRESA